MRLRSACIRRPRSVAWYRRRASRWLRRLTSSAQSGPQYTWPRSHRRQITTCRRQWPQRNNRQEELDAQSDVHESSCGNMAFELNSLILYLNMARAIQSNFGADCGWAADHCNRDRGASHDATPPTPPGIRVRTTAVRRIKHPWVPGFRVRASSWPLRPLARPDAGLHPCQVSASPA